MKTLYRICKRNSRNICVLVCFSLLFFSVNVFAYEKEINDIAIKMAEDIAKAHKTRIAVVDFTDLKGNVVELGRFIAEEFSVALLNTGSNFEVVDRTHLQTLLKEHKLSSTGLIDPQTAQKLGQLAGVEALITGTITSFGDSIRLSAKILDVDTARVLGAKTGNIPKTDAIAQLLEVAITTSTSTASATSTSSSSNSQGSIQMRGFNFALQSCKRSGQSVICYFLVTSENEDKNFEIYRKWNSARSRIFDNLGDEYWTKVVQLGSKSYNDGHVTGFLVAGVPTKASISFEEIASQASTIALLELGCKDDQDSFTVQFRNVAFSK